MLAMQSEQNIAKPFELRTEIHAGFRDEVTTAELKVQSLELELLHKSLRPLLKPKP